MLHAIYRSTAKVNAKPRPPGFSKLSSLESFLAAWPDHGDLIFLNDGPVAGEQLELMEAAGRVTVRSAADAMGAYWTALELALEQGWADEDLVYFGEDDYLYRPETFAALEAAAARLPHVDHFAPYATIGHTMPNGEPLHEGLKRPRLQPLLLADVDGVAWHHATSHTVSYAIRVRSLREDRTLHRLTLKASGAWDHTMCLACQGIVPYTARELIEPLRARTGASASRRAKIVIWRVVLSGLALRRRRDPHVIAAPSPALASHMEVGLTAA
ncbi:hypothetical protein [Solirubrobacter soli]|uniref:hypothetical protein n=1 Tax=Solirubrobacter soli TaxID=363832 RepID=UPI0004049A8F|nr:hypothetical protein [Solirubrobacter soli]